MKTTIAAVAGLVFLLAQPVQAQTPAAPIWKAQTSAPGYPGKQDDIFFLNARQGWYVNGSGQVFRTRDGGTTWAEVAKKPGTYFRCIGMVDSLNGYAGNIGTDYFPGVTDTIPLYRTADGGATWTPVPYEGPRVKGLCAIQIQRLPFINAGKRDERVRILAGGRVGSPAYLLESKDGGATFRSRSLNEQIDYILDIVFRNEKEGILCAAKGSSLDQTYPVILHTSDGGTTWTEAYRGKRPVEITWKGYFPTDKVGYVTLQSYDPDTSKAQRYVLKSTDGGKSWQELPMIRDAQARPFGVAFASADWGWIGTVGYGLETRDGGKTWTKVNLGRAANKIRVVHGADGQFTGFAIGTNVYRIDGRVEAGK